jgi:NADH-quinone oxidoreductase subunit L
MVTLVLLLPLAGFIALVTFGKRLPEPWAGIVATATVGTAFVLALIAALDVFAGTAHPETVTWFQWLPALGVEASFLWDPLSVLMTLVVTGVGSLIHAYSIGYMHGDERYGRFFSYLNLFIFSMLMLVLGSNFAVMFVGWELVGLSSYLLISFWFERPTAAAAGKKAFVVNRVGDVGFLVALMLIFNTFGTLGFHAVFEEAPATLGTGMATAITLMLMLGAAGKSAQLPLYVWLPDAMEGPTPVSALIHAATMVTAGVYMVARTGVLFELAPISSGVVATVGALTALFAATIAVAQFDIKRVLAYSTISQLGYMFMGVGAAAHVAGVFHLMTHAFFKALLFLGAGSVIHGMADEQDMRKMGGLAKFMPWTFGTMTLAWLAISGIPPFAGFWSKDEILASVFGRGGAWIGLWVIGLITAGLTAFYMTRMMWMTFGGSKRWDDEVHPHESPWTMVVPLAVLGGLSVVGGLINTPWKLTLEHFLEPAFEAVHLAHIPGGATPWVLAFVSIAAGIIGIALATSRYRTGTHAEDEGAWKLMNRGYYVDDAYAKAFVVGGGAVATWAAESIDTKGIDGAVNGIAAVTAKVSSWMRPLQTGLVRSYAVAILIGTVGLLAWFLSRGGF